jgi:hypothetical protein
VKPWVEGAVGGGIAAAAVTSVIEAAADGNPAWLAASAACAGAGAAWVAAINASRTLAQTRADSRARTRPMLSAELRADAYAMATQSLVIKNHGPTVARNVVVRFDPEPGDDEVMDGERTVTPYLKRRYANPIASLVPGVELDNLWYVGRPGANGEWVNTEPTPEKVTVSIAFDAPDGVTYEEHFFLDVDVLRKRTSVTSSESPIGLAKSAVKSLKAIDAALRARP